METCAQAALERHRLRRVPLVGAATGHERHIGRYRLVRRLAAGGMADIHLAQLHGPRGYERTVVVKTIRSDLLEEEDLIQMLVEEARIASCLEHENIVQLIEVGEDGDTHFLAMEFAFGKDLQEVRDRCQDRGMSIPVEHVNTIFDRVLDALHYAHHEATFEGRPLNVVHRDVSPQNILIGFDGTVKLLDFGLAKAAAQISRTRAGVLKGKYAYMSPEQVNFKNVDHRADIFSCGVLLWELLTTKRLFFRSSDYDTVRAVMACGAPFPKSVRAEVPWTQSWVAFRALRKSPSWRYRNARQMQRALRANDPRSRDQAEGELAGWMRYLFQEQLAARDLALDRARNDPRRHRQILDAGFELLEEVTDPDLMLRPLVPPPPSLLPPKRAGIIGLATALLGTWHWFIMIFAALVFLSVAAGLFIGSRHRAGDAPPAKYGYLNVEADASDVFIIVGGRALGEAPVTKIPVLPGRHRIVGRRDGKVQTKEVRINAGERRVVRLQFDPKRRR